MIDLAGNSTAVMLALAAVGKLGPVRIKTLLAQAESPVDIARWDIPQLCTVPGISLELAGRIKKNLDVTYGDRIIEWAEKNGVGITTIVDGDYPESLRRLYDAPPVLFVKGSLAGVDGCSVAMVGSRNATDYGRLTASKLAAELAGHGVTIISGMALGIDTSSHRGALAGGGRTVAVLGSGIDVIYPRENRGLYGEIIDSGAVISEFFPGVDPNPGHFPRRNRIIAGLAGAVIVVEAGQKSGALLTADLALTQDKPLFAVPGQLTSKMSSGTNDLIKSGAHLLSSIDDIFSILPELKNGYIAPGRKTPNELSKGEELIYCRLSDTPTQLDTIVRTSGLSVNDTAAYLLSLELRGLVRQLAGKRFITS